MRFELGHAGIEVRLDVLAGRAALQVLELGKLVEARRHLRLLVGAFAFGLCQRGGLLGGDGLDPLGGVGTRLVALRARDKRLQLRQVVARRAHLRALGAADALGFGDLRLQDLDAVVGKGARGIAANLPGELLQLGKIAAERFDLRVFIAAALGCQPLLLFDAAGVLGFGRSLALRDDRADPRVGIGDHLRAGPAAHDGLQTRQVIAYAGKFLALAPTASASR